MEFRVIRNLPRGIWNSVSPAGETESELYSISPWFLAEFVDWNDFFPGTFL